MEFCKAVVELVSRSKNAEAAGGRPGSSGADVLVGDVGEGIVASPSIALLLPLSMVFAASVVGDDGETALARSRRSFSAACSALYVSGSFRTTSTEVVWRRLRSACACETVLSRSILRVVKADAD